MTSLDAESLSSIPFAAPDLHEEDIQAVSAVLRSGWITTGREGDALERELSSFLGNDVHVVATSSCTAALEIAAAYHQLGPGKRVGVPTWTFVSSVLAVMRYGATPVLLDVDPNTLNIDPNSLREAITVGKLDALVAVHMGGVPVDREIHDICHENAITIIEDAAHALGARDDRGPIGSASDSGTCFSFYATKNLTSAEGGAFTTTDAAIAEFARSYRLHGLSSDAYRRYQPGQWSDYDLQYPGIKANLPDVLAALARSQLRRFGESQRRRRDLVTRYRDHLDGMKRVQVHPKEPDSRSADHLMLISVPAMDRTTLRSKLMADGISTSVHFRPLHTFAWLSKRAERAPSGTPAADRLRYAVLSLPLHTRLSDSDVDFICTSLESHLSKP